MKIWFFLHLSLLSTLFLSVPPTRAEEQTDTAEERPYRQNGALEDRPVRGPGGAMPTFEPLPVTAEHADQPVPDARIHVPMPVEQRQILREQMKTFLVTLARIQGLMAEGDLAEAAVLAETSMGRSERGKHRGKGGPGLYMPVPMRTLAWEMHDRASEFALVAQEGDVTESYRALQRLQTSCISCHITYSTR